MVNAGAIATTSLVPGTTVEAKWRFLHEGLSRFAGRELALNEEVYACASQTNFRNRSIACLLQSFDRIYFDPAEATDLYTRQCSLNVSAKDLAAMGATLADGGVNPLTRERVVDAMVCHYTLAVMTTAGLYETSGDWLYDIGLPGKSGISGGIVTVSPGKADWGLSPRRWTARETASRAGSSPNSFPNAWEWICSSRSPKNSGRPWSAQVSRSPGSLCHEAHPHRPRNAIPLPSTGQIRCAPRAVAAARRT
jgi:hypothetical protein